MIVVADSGPADPLSSIRLSEEWHLDECLKLIIVDSGRVLLPIARFNEPMLHCGRPLVSPWFFDYFFRTLKPSINSAGR